MTTRLNFSAAVDDWTKESLDRTERVLKMSIQGTVEAILDRTPIDTGFLKGSWKSSLSGFSPLVREGVVQSPEYELTIAGMKLGDAYFGNYAAEYAIYVEEGARNRTGRHMVKLAAQNWQATVDQAADQLRGSR